MSAARMQYGLNHELREYSDSWIIFSPYVTFWAEGNYYILAKREGQEELEHFRIDTLVRIVAIPSKMKAWVMLHMEECEVLSPRRFRDELQNIIMSAYRKYFGQKISKSPEK